MSNKIQQSINLIRKLETDSLYLLAFSGGKDSVVLLDLAKKAKVKYSAEYTNTTIDTPGHINFIRENYSEVKIVQPPKSFYQLIIDRGLPRRKSRFCCQYLKEFNSIGKRVVEGTRRKESYKRSNYEFEQCDNRKWMNDCKHIRPLLLWTESEIWQYIRDKNLIYPKYYDPPYNFKRMGCIGCPVSNVANRIREYKLFPKYALVVIKTIKKRIELKPDCTFAVNFQNEYEVFYWWLQEFSIKVYIGLRESNLFPILDYEKHIKDFLYEKTNI